ncbi:hypothetical protein BDV93DRAFT_225742 [Ceratobasidium sp. AG-I]|nr:hypothetical protein BDV93DRAFT_225742 [Ceratobasidium sp. AG-I]
MDTLFLLLLIPMCTLIPLTALLTVLEVVGPSLIAAFVFLHAFKCWDICFSIGEFTASPCLEIKPKSKVPPPHGAGVLPVYNCEALNPLEFATHCPIMRLVKYLGLNQHVSISLGFNLERCLSSVTALALGSEE